jgi:predicted alpha/beta hydrolase
MQNRELMIIVPDIGVQQVGHFGFFRPAFEATLWAQSATWLLEV